MRGPLPKNVGTNNYISGSTSAKNWLINIILGKSSIPSFSLALFDRSRRNRRTQQQLSKPLIEVWSRCSTHLTSKLSVILKQDDRQQRN
jgi:hypothetical protein